MPAPSLLQGGKPPWGFREASDIGHWTGQDRPWPMGRGGRPSSLRGERRPSTSHWCHLFFVSRGGRRTLGERSPTLTGSQALLPSSAHCSPTSSVLCLHPWSHSQHANIPTVEDWPTKQTQSYPVESPGHTEQASEKGWGVWWGHRSDPEFQGGLCRTLEGGRRGVLGQGTGLVTPAGWGTGNTERAVRGDRGPR